MYALKPTKLKSSINKYTFFIKKGKIKIITIKTQKNIIQQTHQRSPQIQQKNCYHSHES